MTEVEKNLARTIKTREKVEAFVLYAIVIFAIFVVSFAFISLAAASDTELPRDISKTLPSTITQQDKELVEDILEPENLNPIDVYIFEICKGYENVSPNLVRSVVYHESTYNPEAVNYNGTCVGLMQVSTRWHKDRAVRLGVKDFFDPYENILLGVDYLSELIDNCGSVELALMSYNMGYSKAKDIYNSGRVTKYATSIISMTESLDNGGVIFL